MDHTYLPSRWRKDEDKKKNHFVLQLCLAIFGIALFLLPMVSQASGGYLNVNIYSDTQHGGEVKASDISYEVHYDGTFDVLTGSVQGYDFPRHTYNVIEGDIPLTYWVNPVSIPGYSIKLGKGGCNDTFDRAKDRAIRISSCSIYVADNNLEVLQMEDVRDFEEVPFVTTTELNAQIAQLMQMIDLLKQLIALQGQLSALKGI